MPLVVLYVPSTDLIRQGGRITDSGNIIVNRPVPFRLVKEVWFCVPEGNSEGKYEILEKIMDESLEDELVLDYKASPIFDGYKRYRTPAHVMTHDHSLRNADRTTSSGEGEVTARACGSS